MRDTSRRLEVHRCERRRSEDDRRIVGKAVAFFRKAEHAPVEFPVAVFVMINGDGVDSRSRHGQAGDGYRHFRLYPETREFPTRSEEHTSELQSLMRITYAVFCL